MTDDTDLVTYPDLATLLGPTVCAFMEKNGGDVAGIAHGLSELAAVRLNRQYARLMLDAMLLASLPRSKGGGPKEKS